MRGGGKRHRRGTMKSERDMDGTTTGKGKTACVPSVSGSMLKLAALLSMAADHYALFFMREGTWAREAVRCAGRLAFPAFAFLAAEGFRHTRDRRRYFLTLAGFALASEVPWRMLHGGGGGGTHNAMFTLALGVAAMAATERLRKCPAACMCAVSCLLCAAALFRADYGWREVAMIAVFHLAGEEGEGFPAPRRVLQLALAFPFMAHYGVAGAVLACAAIALYDGTRGFIDDFIIKYSFYAFYPLHLLLVAVIR